MITVNTDGEAHCDACDKTFAGVLLFEGAPCPNPLCPSNQKQEESDG